MSDIGEIGFLDIHYHSNPDLYHRRYTALEAGQFYRESGGGVVLKSHLGSTACAAHIAQANGYPVWGSVVLNDIAGGISYKSVLRALANSKPDEGMRLLVHFPTITGRAHQSRLERQGVYPKYQTDLCQPLTVSDEQGYLRQSVWDIIKMAKDFPITLSTGHANQAEVFELVNACLKIGVDRLLLNQPANPMTGLSYTDLKQLTQEPLVWIEQTALTYLLGYQSFGDFQNVIKHLPQVIYSSDLGQTSQMMVAEWCQRTTHWFDRMNLSKRRRNEVCHKNPIKLLSL